MWLLAIALSLFAYSIYKFIIWPIQYWEKLGVPHTKGWKFFYTNWFITFKGQSSRYYVQDLYDTVPNSKYHGIHEFNRPYLIAKDPELIKKITIKDFDHFSDRRFSVSVAMDPLFANNLLHLKGEKWHVLRKVSTASFTTNKMKLLLQIMEKSGSNFVEHFLGKQEKIIELDMQEAFIRYTNDVIAGCVFGAEVNSLKEPENEFFLRGKQATNLTKFPTNMKFMTAVFFPKLYKILGLRLIPDEARAFFTNLIDDSIQLRKEGKIVQTDMMQLMLETMKEYDAKHDENHNNGEQLPKIAITYEDMVSQAFVFFFAGFESAAKSMSFLAYELAVNPDIQRKLREEIQETNDKCNEKVTYETLMGMKYMDMVVSEALRKYPVIVMTDRLCTKDYTLEPSKEGQKPVYIPKGTVVLVPIHAIQHDPQYYPDPEKFIPERFSDENKSNLTPYAYQTFGVGPRMCTATRFAIMEIKLLFFHMLSKFKIVPIQKTTIPLVYKKSIMTLSSENGFWLGLKRI